MQQLLMKTIPYDRKVEYIHDPDNTVADWFSRALIKTDTIQLPILQVQQITNNPKCRADWLKQVCYKNSQSQ